MYEWVFGKVGKIVEKNEINLLVQKAKNGNQEAFTLLIMNMKEQLYRIIYAIVQNQEDTLEVLNEVMYKSYINLENLQNNEFFKTWITRIAINEAKNYIKKNSKILYIEEYEETVGTKDEYNEEKIDIEQAMKKLEPNTKSILVMKLYLDYTFDDIARNLDKPLSTIKTAYYAGIEKLKKYLRVEEVSE